MARARNTSSSCLISDISPDQFSCSSPGWSLGCYVFCDMSHSARLTRRKFMQITAVTTAAGPMAACIGPGNPWRCLSEDEGRTLEAICERIIPADQDPGAAWAGVVTFVDRQLMGPYRRLRKTYRLGIAGTNATGVAMFGKPFVALTSQQQ